MIAEFGVCCLVIALLASAFQFSYFFAGRWQSVVARCIPSATWLQALVITFAFASLMLLRIDSDFSVLNVVQHSNLSLPLLYKIAGTWSNHEGSMLLWLLIMAVFAVALGMRIEKNPEWITPALAVQAGLIAGTCAFVLYTSNPFIRVFPPADDGNALNPLLQDIGLAIHPPLLYLGYVGFSLVFSLSVAALVTGKAGSDWARLAQPWILCAWSALTVGIGLGSWWAYRELGWGGWWFWDPVENASLLPWLAGLALLHSNIVLKKRNALASWVLLLAIITFALSLIGTFLVRSGALTSVHSFASDPARGLFILVFIVISVGGALTLYAMRVLRIQSSEVVTLISREGMMLVNNIFMLTACATVLLGTLYPMAADLFGQQLTVGAPYFNATFLPIMVLPLIIAAVAPVSAWNNTSLKQTMRQLTPAAIALWAAIFLVLAYADSHRVTAMVGFMLTAWLGVSSVIVLVRKKNRSVLAVSMAHLGVALLVAGITAEGLWKTQSEAWLKTGETISVGSYSLTLAEEKYFELSNYRAARATFVVQNKHGEKIAHLYPELRHYIIRGSETSEASIYSGLAGDVYVVIGETSKDGRVATRAYYVPMIWLIWMGFAFMAAGGILAMTQTRKRVDFGKTGI